MRGRGGLMLVAVCTVGGCVMLPVRERPAADTRVDDVGDRVDAVTMSGDASIETGPTADAVPMDAGTTADAGPEIVAVDATRPAIEAGTVTDAGTSDARADTAAPVDVSMTDATRAGTTCATAIELPGAGPWTLTVPAGDALVDGHRAQWTRWTIYHWVTPRPGSMSYAYCSTASMRTAIARIVDTTRTDRAGCEQYVSDYLTGDLDPDHATCRTDILAMDVVQGQSVWFEVGSERGSAADEPVTLTVTWP